MKNEKWDDVHGNTTPDDRMVAFLESPTDSYAILQLREDPMLLNDMILTESLFPHLWEIEETAKARVEFLMEQYLKDSPAPDKETQQMAWVQHMNSLKAQAEEVVMTELINS